MIELSVDEAVNGLMELLAEFQDTKAAGVVPIVQPQAPHSVGTCEKIVNTLPGGKFQFCGKPTPPRSSYCSQCRSRMYVQRRDKRPLNQAA